MLTFLLYNCFFSNNGQKFYQYALRQCDSCLVLVFKILTVSVIRRYLLKKKCRYCSLFVEIPCYIVCLGCSYLPEDETMAGQCFHFIGVTSYPETI
jgi:uncharacterized membrane protein YoaT (DUF817 family)